MCPYTADINPVLHADCYVTSRVLGVMHHASIRGVQMLSYCYNIFTSILRDDRLCMTTVPSIMGLCMEDRPP